jgi:hypothetical protein
MPRRVAAVALALVVALAGAPAAEAAFENVAAPQGRIVDFAASPTTWLLVTETGPGRQVWRSADGGASWDLLELEPGWYAVGTGPDGALYVSVSTASPKLLRFGEQGGGQEVPTGLTASGFQIRMSAPSFDAQGRMWLGLSQAATPLSANITLARIENGAVAESASIDARVGSDEIDVDAAGPAPIINASGTYLLTGGVLRALQGSPGLPKWRRGALTLWDDFISEDGGLTTHAAEHHLLWLHGDDRHAAWAGVLLEPHEGLMVATGLTFPPNTGEVWATRGGYVAVSESRGSQFVAFHAGDAPPRPAIVGNPSSKGRQFVARMNQVRAAQGLLPFAPNELFSKAADNHSRYWERNHPWHSGEGMHYEQRGKPGFTGREPIQRCLHVGAGCGAEIIVEGEGPPPRASVDGWAATLYHGFSIRQALPGQAGGGVRPRGPAVMEFGVDAGFLTAPTGAPRGRYIGALGFDNEVPDPAVECAEEHQRITPPYGATATVELPSGGIPRAMTMTGPGGKRLPGCFVRDSFVPDNPLKPHTTYTVTARWGWFDEETAPRTYTWSFRTR